MSDRQRSLSDRISINFLRNYQKLQHHHQDLDDRINSDQTITGVCGVPYITKIYCLNLQSCLGRRKHMKKQFKMHNFQASFFNAIHPRHKEFKKRYHNDRWVDRGWNKTRCYCVIPCRHRVRKLRQTEVAISLSHYYIYDKMVKRNDSGWYLICEDDLIFSNRFCDILNHVIPKSIWEDEEPCIIFCGGETDNYQLQITDPEKFKYRQMSNGCYSNYCYLINLGAAQVLHQNFFPITRPEDSFKRFWIAKKKIKSYRICPVIVGELSSGKNFDAVYSRLSLYEAPPKINGSPEREYQRQYLENEKERSRLEKERLKKQKNRSKTQKDRSKKQKNISKTQKDRPKTQKDRLKTQKDRLKIPRDQSRKNARDQSRKNARDQSRKNARDQSRKNARDQSRKNARDQSRKNARDQSRKNARDQSRKNARDQSRKNQKKHGHVKGVQVITYNKKRTKK